MSAVRFFTPLPPPQLRLLVSNRCSLIWPVNCLPPPSVFALIVALALSKVVNVSHCCFEKWELCPER